MWNSYNITYAGIARQHQIGLKTAFDGCKCQKESHFHQLLLSAVNKKRQGFRTAGSGKAYRVVYAKQQGQEAKSGTNTFNIGGTDVYLFPHKIRHT